MLPSGQFKLAQIFSAKYLELVPENTIKGAFSLIFVIVVSYSYLICMQR